MAEIVNKYEFNSELQEIGASGMENEVKVFTRKISDSSATTGQHMLTKHSRDDLVLHEGISITTAIFMVILIAVSAILMLCCCKAYLLCFKRRRTLSRNCDDEVRFHVHLQDEIVFVRRE